LFDFLTDLPKGAFKEFVVNAVEKHFLEVPWMNPSSSPSNSQGLFLERFIELITIEKAKGIGFELQLLKAVKKGWKSIVKISRSIPT
jgi:hypothetical protein